MRVSDDIDVMYILTLLMLQWRVCSSGQSDLISTAAKKHKSLLPVAFSCCCLNAWINRASHSHSHLSKSSGYAKCVTFFFFFWLTSFSPWEMYCSHAKFLLPKCACSSCWKITKRSIDLDEMVSEKAPGCRFGGEDILNDECVVDDWEPPQILTFLKSTKRFTVLMSL